jgi:peroxiredoxin, ohr subfamily
MSVPKEMGGAGDGANPEQLFALGYAACFHSALKLVAGKAKADTTDSAVGAYVSIGSNDQGGFQLTVVLEVSLPNVSPEQAQELADAEHRRVPTPMQLAATLTCRLRSSTTKDIAPQWAESLQKALSSI